jgi:tripartite-type tricarboxylate transporter receptor subunit TctC
MAKGEVAGFCALPWPVIRSFWQHELKSGEFKLILQLAGDKRPQFGGIPHIKEFIRSDDDRSLFGLIFDVLVLVRTYAMPPDVPPDRIAAMRKAFMATMRDPLFVADATKAGMDLSPAPGEEVARDWLAFASTPRPLIERAKHVMMLK